MSHKLFSVWMLLLAGLLWWLAIASRSNDVGLICKMVCNISLMLATVTAFGNLYIDRKEEHNVWTIIITSPVALAQLLGAIAISSGICVIGTLVVFSGQ